MVGPPLKKGIKLIKAVYPKAESTTLNPQALEALIKYILTTPHKLSDIAKYIEKRVKKDIAKSRYGFLQISLEVVHNVLRTCHSNLLTLYAPNVVNILQEIFLLDRNLNTKNVTPGSPMSTVVTNIYKMKMLAVETFEQFAKSRQNNNVAEYKDLGFFVDYFVDMAGNNSDAELRKKMRVHGMRALHVYITTVEDLDSFVNRYIESKDKNNKIVLSTILTNIEKPADTKLDEIDFNNVYSLCVACLRELTRSASAITIQALLTAVLEFLDEKKVWTTQGFAKDCMKAISQKPQTTSITFPILVRHVESVKDSATKIAVVETIIFLAEGSAKGSIGSLIELIFHLVSQLMTSSGVEEQDEGLQKAIVNCIGVVSKIAEMNEKIAAMKQLLDKIKIEKEEKISTALLECMAQIAMNFKELQPAKSIELVEPLASLPMSKHPEHRAAVLKIFQYILNVPSRRGSVSFSLFKSTDGSEEKKVEKRNDMIRLAAFQQLQLEDNEPFNYEAIFKVFSLLVQVSRGKELERSLPSLLKIEGSILSKYAPVPHVMRSIHAVVGSYLLFVSKAFAANELEEYVTKIMTDAWTNVLVWEQDQLVAKKLKFKKKHKKVDPIATLFDHDMVIQLVSKSQQITNEFGTKDIQQVFSHEKIASASTALESSPSSPLLNTQERVIPIVQIPATSQLEVAKKEKFKFLDLKSIFAEDEKESKKEKSSESKPLVVKSLSFHTTVALCKDQEKKNKNLNELLELMLPEEKSESNFSDTCTLTLKFPVLLHDLTNLHLNKQFTVA